MKILINTSHYNLWVDDTPHKEELFPYTVAERLANGNYHLWQVDNPNDWDEDNQFKILAHTPINGSPILNGIPIISKEDSKEISLYRQEYCNERKVICTKKVYIYEVGKTYYAKYLYDRCLVGHYVEYEWMVFHSEHNHYQFTDSEFNECFADLIETRDFKISQILKDE
jgi:hypothetical protein